MPRLAREDWALSDPSKAGHPMIERDQTIFPDGNLRSPALVRRHGMEVLCTSDERYLPHAATMLCSLLDRNSGRRIPFYSSVGSHELAKLKSLTARYGSEIALYEALPSDFEDLRVDKWVSFAVYYRLLGPPAFAHGH
jgi:hypothetical protein